MSLVVILLPALATFPQDVREPVEIGPSYSHSLVLASEDDLSVAAWLVNTDAQPSADEVLLSISDGRGLDWSGPQAVEQAPAGVPVSPARVDVVEERAFVVWADDRYDLPGSSVSTPFLRVYDAASGTLGPEVQVPTGSAVNRTRVSGLDLDAERVGAQVRVHVAMFVHVEPLAGPAYDELQLVTTTDAGASFLPPLVIPMPAPPPTAYSAFPLRTQAESGVVHVMWLDQRTGLPQVFYQRSSDGGLTPDFAVDQQLTALSDILSFRFDAQGPTLAFAVDEVLSDGISPGFKFADVSAAVSTDGGTTFGPLQSVPLADPFTHQALSPAVAVGSGGEVLLAWKREYPSPDSVFSSRTVDGGATWSGEVQLSETQGRSPQLVASGPGRERAVAAWFGENHFPTGGIPSARQSSDGGATWGPAVELGAPMHNGAGELTQLTFNDRYQNLIAGWGGKDSPHPVFIGGFRPQTLTPAGFTAGATQVGAAFERFDDGSPLAFLLVSTQAGDLQLPFGDPRNSGLGLTPLLLTTASLAASGTFAAPLDSAGAGALAPLSAVLPAGLTLYALGLAFDVATLSCGDASDVVRIDL